MTTYKNGDNNIVVVVENVCKKLWKKVTSTAIFISSRWLKVQNTTKKLQSNSEKLRK